MPLKFSSFLHFLLICFIFIIFSIIFLLPLILKINDSILGSRGGDNFGVLTRLNNCKEQHDKYINGQIDYSINYPFGLNLTDSAPLLLHCSTLSHINIFRNPILFYNLIIFFSFPLAGLSLYYLIYYITRGHLASLLLGLAYLISPYHFISSEGHLSLAYICWLPIFILTLLLFKQKQNFRRLLLIIISLSVQFLFDYQYAVFALIFLLIFFAVWLFDSLSNKKLITFISKNIIVFSLIFICLVLMSIFGLSFIKNKLGLELSRPIGDLISYSAHPIEYIIPSLTNPILGNFTKEIFISPRFRHSVLSERILYVGIVPLILAGYAIYQWRKKRRIDDFWKKKDFLMTLFSISLLASFIISMSPPISPSFLIYKILPQLRVYSRFVVLIMISLYVLAGIGFAYILQRVGKKKKILLFGLALILIIIEFMPTYTLTNVREIPLVYQWLKKQDNSSVIIEYPFTFVNLPPSYTYFYYQQYHGKRMVNGAPNNTVGEDIRQIVTDITDPKIIPNLQLLGIDYIIIHSKEYGVIYEPYPDSKLPSEQNLPIGTNYSKINPKLKLVENFGDDYVYEILNEN